MGCVKPTDESKSISGPNSIDPIWRIAASIPSLAALDKIDCDVAPCCCHEPSNGYDAYPPHRDVGNLPSVE